MTDSIDQRLKKAVTEGFIARGAYFQSMGLPDEQALGAPAVAEKLNFVEQRIGKRLPASYRHFLTMHDGWRMVDGGVGLLPVEELLSGARHEAIQALQKEMGARGDAVAARGLVGASSITATKSILDPDVTDESGEWRLVQHHGGEEAQVPSFLQWLEESVEEYRELARSAHDD